MTFKEYQKLSRQTALYPEVNKNFIYPRLGLAGAVITDNGNFSLELT